MTELNSHLPNFVDTAQHEEATLTEIIKQFLENDRYKHSRKNEKSEGQLMFLEPNIQHDGDR